ncbi:MAG: glycosyltransferase family 2 protein [Pseudomonadota bacterium]
MKKKVCVIIPALNEENSIGLVIRDIPKDSADEIIVVDNGSTDMTAEKACSEGARVVKEKHRGYGAACLAGIAHAGTPDIIVFLDGDYSDYPEEMQKIIAPLIQGEADLVIGSRIAGSCGKNVLLPQAYWGNKLATWLIFILYKHRFTDLGPFRAINYTALQKLGMGDKNFGWTIEMQVKAIKKGLRIKEIPVSYRPRIGTSKISGTITGSIKAGLKILYTLFSLR